MRLEVGQNNGFKKRELVLKLTPGSAGRCVRYLNSIDIGIGPDARDAGRFREGRAGAGVGGSFTSADEHSTTWSLILPSAA
jgi:hypothetical protein